MHAQLETRDAWVNDLETNAYAVKPLTLRKALEVAAEGCCAGWYISPYVVKTGDLRAQPA